MRKDHVLPQYIAEFIGTFCLVFFGCGAVILSDLDPSFNSGLIPIIFGGAVSIMVYTIGHISGAHINPAVTLAFWSIGRFKGIRVPGYIISQLLGASLASLAHKFIWGVEHSFGITTLNTTLSSGIAVEFIISFMLMFVVIGVATDSRAVGELAGVAIGTTVAICAFVGGPLTGASMNPARTLGPALVSGKYDSLWLYLTIPILGTLFGAKVYEWIRCHRDDSNDTHGCC